MMLILMLIMMLRFCVKESSNLIGTAGFFITVGWVCALPFSQKVTKSPPTPDPFPHQIFRFTKFLHYYYLAKFISWSKNKNGYKIFQQQNKSVFQGNLHKTFCLWCTFLQEVVIHDHEGLTQAEKFYYPTKIFEISTAIASFC